MKFRKAHIWVAQFEVMKVFVLKMKKEKKKVYILRQKNVTFLTLTCVQLSLH